MHRVIALVIFFVLFCLIIPAYAQGESEGLFNSTYAKFAKSDYQGAIQDLSLLILKNLDFTNAYLFRGVAKEKLKDFRGALADFDKVIELDVNAFEAFYWRASTKAELGNYRGAVDDLDMATRINPNFAKAYFWKAEIKIGIKDYKGAEQDMETAIKLDSNLSKTYYWRADKIKPPPILILSPNGAVLVNPNSADIHFWNGTCRAEFKGSGIPAKE